jgi:hypothetical protein
MIFYSVEKNLVVNSKKTNKIICRFKDGRYETNDPILIEKLKEHFRYSNNPTVHFLDFVKLRKEAASKGINTFHKSKPEIMKALEELEVQNSIVDEEHVFKKKNLKEVKNNEKS